MNINNRTDVDVIIWLAEKSRVELLSYSFFVENINSLTISSYSIDARVENKDSAFCILSATDKARVVKFERIFYYLHTHPELANQRSLDFARRGSEWNRVAIKAHMTVVKTNFKAFDMVFDSDFFSPDRDSAFI